MTSDNLIWIREGPEDVKTYPRKTQYVRRSHKKSRGGCELCKARRVKVASSILASADAVNLTQSSAMREGPSVASAPTEAQIAHSS